VVFLAREHAIFNRLIHQVHELVGFYAMIIPIAIIVRGIQLVSEEWRGDSPEFDQSIDYQLNTVVLSSQVWFVVKNFIKTVPISKLTVIIR